MKHSDNITDSKRKEAEIRRLASFPQLSPNPVLEADAEEMLLKLESVLENIHEGVVIADLGGNILTMNGSALAMHEYESVEQVRRQLHQFQDTFELSELDGRPVPFEEWPLSRALRGERFADREVVVRRKDTGKTWVGSYSGTPVRNKSGDAILAVITLRDITERLRKEEALRLSEERLRYASTAADIGMWHWDLVNNDLIWNDKCKELHGYPPDCLVTYEAFLKTLLEEDRQRIDGVVQRSLRDKTDYSVEMRVLLPDGQSRWIMSKGCGFYDEQGKPVRMTGVSMDITERKRMEAEMEHFASFPILNPTPIIEMDSDGKVTFCNRAAEEVLGKAECFDNGNPLIPGDVPDMLRDLRQDKIRQFQRSVEMDGLVFDEMIYLAPEYDAVRIYAVNVTERRRLEEERGRLAAIVESSDDAIIAKTLDGIIVEWNRGAENLYGYTASEIKGRHISTLAPSDRLDEVPLILEKIGCGERVEHIETMRVTKDGRRVPVLLTISPIKDTSGKIIGAATIAHDITDRKRAEEKIEQLNTELAARALELEAVNRELEAFNYSVAHDLRRPLTVINGYCQVIQEMCGNGLDEQCMRYLREAYEGTLRMNQLIDTLLNFSRLAHVELHPEPFDLSAMAREIAAELETSEPARRVSFRIAGGIPVNGDARLVRVVMENLFGNAWKYTGAQEEAVIEFGMTDFNDKLAYFVRDNGPGFAMADAEKLFIPFQRLPGSNEFKGHGIGLATVERVIRRHGGRIWAEGEPGKGATFYFTLDSAMTENK